MADEGEVKLEEVRMGKNCGFWQKASRNERALARAKILVSLDCSNPVIPQTSCSQQTALEQANPDVVFTCKGKKGKKETFTCKDKNGGQGKLPNSKLRYP